MVSSAAMNKTMATLATVVLVASSSLLAVAPAPVIAADLDSASAPRIRGGRRSAKMTADPTAFNDALLQDNTLEEDGPIDIDVDVEFADEEPVDLLHASTVISGGDSVHNDMQEDAYYDRELARGGNGGGGGGKKKPVASPTPMPVSSPVSSPVSAPTPPPVTSCGQCASDSSISCIPGTGGSVSFCGMCNAKSTNVGNPCFTASDCPPDGRGTKCNIGASDACLPCPAPTDSPSGRPSVGSSAGPSASPTRMDSDAPSSAPSSLPSNTPSMSSEEPSVSPSSDPSNSPTMSSEEPSVSPSSDLSNSPTMSSDSPSSVLSSTPSMSPTTSLAPSSSPTQCQNHTDCSDEIDCTIDECISGYCSNIPNNDACSDGNECTLDTCSIEFAGCILNATVMDGSTCNDGNIFTHGDRCEAGVCIGTQHPSSTPSSVPSDSPTSQPSISTAPSSTPSSTPSSAPSDTPTSRPSLSSLPSSMPTVSSAPSISSAPSSAPTAFVPRAAWMSGKHGIGYRVPGGINSNTYAYDATLFANQIKDIPISYVIVGLSGGATGDQYLSPHPVLESIGSRNTAPKDINSCSTTIDLSAVPDIDVFDNLLVAMEAINVKVIAYMGATGPPKLKEGEADVFDFGGDGCYVNAAVECLQFGINDGQCSPSARKWVHWVATNFTDPPMETYNFADVYVDGSALNLAAKQAYADVIVGHYAERFGDRIAGYWFDQGTYSNPTAIIQAIRRGSDKAAVAINRGIKIPLQNNNPPPESDRNAGEDFTFGHMVPHQTNTNPVDGCYNYGLVLSAEASKDGYVYPQVSPANTDLSQPQSSNPYVDPNFLIRYNETTPNEASLAHIFMPTSQSWNGGSNVVWDVDQATEWMKRVLDAKGAWTWNVRRRGCSGCTTEGTNPSEINYPDVRFLESVYAGLPGGSNPISDTYYYNATNCDCVSSNAEGTNRGFGCAVPPPLPEQCQDEPFTTQVYNSRLGVWQDKGCNFICKNICGWCTGPVGPFPSNYNYDLYPEGSGARCFNYYDKFNSTIRADAACKCCSSECRDPYLTNGECYLAENCLGNIQQ